MFYSPFLTFINVHIQNLLLPQYLATGARFAAVAVTEPLALALTARADG